MKWTADTLAMLGLSDTETEILASLNTPKSVQDIANETRLSRSGITYALKQLSKRDLVAHFRHGKRIRYVAAGAQSLARKLEKAGEELRIEEGGVKGVRIRTSKENEFIIHVGVKEIIPAYSRIALMNKSERVRGLQHHRSYKEIVEKASSKLLAEFNGAIIKNDIILDGILNESAYSAYIQELKADPKKFKGAVESLEGRMADYHVFPDNFFNYDAELWVFKGTALIINWHEEVAIEITNTNMTGFLKDMFEFVKMGGRKIDHNAMMRGVMASVPQEGEKKVKRNL